MGYNSRMEGDLSVRVVDHVLLSDTEKVGEWQLTESSREQMYTLRYITDTEKVKATIDFHGQAVIAEVEVELIYGIEVKNDEGKNLETYGVRELERLANALPNGVELRGYLIRYGEDGGDIERYTVQGSDYGKRKVVSEKPTITWPDGTILVP